MKEHGILMSAPMVKAYLADLKTQTRRTRGLDKINENPDQWDFTGIALNLSGQRVAAFSNNQRIEFVNVKLPYGYVGDRLWFRETWAASPLVLQYKEQKDVVYRADDWPACPYDKWRSSLLMFRWAARIVTPVVGVRAERLHSITPDDVLAEGIERTEDRSWLGPARGHSTALYPYAHAHEAYFALWDKLNGKKLPSEKNPWLFVYEFASLTNAARILAPNKKEVQHVEA